jgi:hypothetical protein
MADKRRAVELELVGTDESGKTILELIESTEEARATQSAAAAPAAETADTQAPADAPRAIPERLELVAEQEIVLRCGEASITLTKAGKIVLRGAYVLSRSSGVNKIKGGSVQIN